MLLRDYTGVNRLPSFLHCSVALAVALAATHVNALPIQLSVGQTAAVRGGKVTLLRVLDSRCPPRAYCIMAGNLAASLMVTKGQTTRTLKLLLPGDAVNSPLGKLKLTSGTRLDRGKKQILVLEVTP